MRRQSLVALTAVTGIAFSLPVLAAAGRDSEAVAAYQRLLAMPGITDAEREQAEAALQKR